MLARILYCMPCVCVCYKSVLHEGFFRPVLHCVLRKLIYLQKYGYFLLELFSKPRKKILHGISIVERAIDLARERWTLRA